MNRLVETLANLPKLGRGPALMTHVVAGYPSLRESGEIVRAMADAGASIIELQIPFSDPIADGPTIMAANEAALANGVKVRDCLKLVETLSTKVSTPLLLMTYFNILYRYNHGRDGVRSFCRAAASAGVQGLIVPDLPPEEEHVEHYWEIARQSKLLPVPIVTPTTGRSRLSVIKPFTEDGFVYCVSTTGTTGARTALPKSLPNYIKQVRSALKLPVAVGFGIKQAIKWAFAVASVTSALQVAAAEKPWPMAR